MIDLEQVDVEEFKCGRCGELVKTYWMKDNTGMISDSASTLVGDVIFHSECWDKVVDEFIAYEKETIS